MTGMKSVKFEGLGGTGVYYSSASASIFAGTTKEDGHNRMPSAYYPRPLITADTISYGIT